MQSSARDVFAQAAFDPYRGDEMQPGRGVQTDAEIDAFARARADSAYHPFGTCRTFRLLFFIHISDSLTRTGCLIFLPLLLLQKGSDQPTIGLALSLLFGGGAAGKLAMGRIGARLGVVMSVVLTEAATTALVFALLPPSLAAALILLPLVGLMLNGTSSVLYGTVPEFVAAEKRTHAFAIFYTGGSAAGAVGPLLFGLWGDAVGLVPTMATVALVALITVPMAWALRPAFKET